MSYTDIPIGSVELLLTACLLASIPLAIFYTGHSRQGCFLRRIVAPGIGNSAASGDRAFVAFWQGARNVDYCGCRLVAKSEAGQALRAEQVEGDALVGLVVFRAVVVVERARIE